MAIRVLIADPDRTLLAAYQARLSQEGFEVRTATNGVDCLDALNGFEPDVLVLEPEMPWGGGEGVLDVMHEVFELPLVPVFVITSRENFGRLDAKQFVRQFPLVTHMQTKPVGPDELVRLVRHIANEPRPREEDLRKPTPRPGKKSRLVGVKDGRATYLGATP
jgi:DNA-binding NtrC family response regulator